ncbi:type I-F CRISPR-associated protein Csy1 [Cardiobacteriaceae bacterium TAE3-ERU3]|nr:type I-F CRISPR-associated protein Csy1 [Cardiobacteriaceae bacterium TAE3-ERU3]
MTDINADTFRQAVTAFLQAQFEKKSDKQHKALDKAREAGDSAAIANLEAEIADIRDKYARDNWMDEAANRLAKQLNFGTHISKGIHPDAKGDNVTFSNPPDLPDTLIGSQTIGDLMLDANGNAAALPLAAFFDWPVTDSLHIRDVIQQHPELAQPALAADQQTAAAYLQIFQTTLSGDMTAPQTHERNKQILWPVGSLDEDAYHCLVPLYPSALTHHVKNTLDDLRWSDTNKTARSNRYKANAEQQPYVTLDNLAVLQLGGAKPQNISQLMSKQGGRNYLLPSLPPTYHSDGYPGLTRNGTTLFNKSLYRHCSLLFCGLSEVVKNPRNNVDVREYRTKLVEKLVLRVLDVAKHHRNDHPAGWTRQFEELDEMQVFWLDPHRGTLDGESDYENRDEEDWRTPIKKDFAAWAVARLQTLCKEQAQDFADAEIRYWRKFFIDGINTLARQNEEVWT